MNQFYPNDPGYVFDDVDLRLYNISPHFIYDAPARRAELEAQMPTYKPAPHPLHNIRPGA